MWKRFFGPHCQIVGLDIDPRCMELEEDQIAIRIGDQSDSSFLQEVIDEFGTPSVILDDGSHMMAAVLKSFGFLYPRMASDGVYFVEDMHTSYMSKYGGGTGRPGSFIEHAKGLIDELNADWTQGAVPVSEFTRNTLSIHFYESCVVFERGRHLPKSVPKIGIPSF